MGWTMPKLKKPPDRYAALRTMIRGSMKDKGVTQEDVASWLGYCRQTANRKLNDPGELTLYEIKKIAVKLDIPTDSMRAAIPIR